MRTRIAYIASNTFREAVRDRVLYNLIEMCIRDSATTTQAQ